MPEKNKAVRSIISYKVFNSAEDFVAWQNDNPQFGIRTVQPIFESMQLESYEEQKALTKTSGEVKAACFVTYFWNVDANLEMIKD